MKAYLCLFFALGIASFGVLCKAANIAQVLETNRVTESLNDQQQVTFDRADAKQQIAEELIAGRMTLAAAADKFGELNKKAPECMTAVRLTYTGDSDKEFLCREVINRVKIALEERTAEAERVIPRLEKEMQENFDDSNQKDE